MVPVEGGSSGTKIGSDLFILALLEEVVERGRKKALGRANLPADPLLRRGVTYE